MASLSAAKKQEELNVKKVRDLLRLPENKKCFDCPTKSPFFVNVNVQTFICSRCSGMVREVGHRVKSISASKFSGPEVVALQLGGNKVAHDIWLSNYTMHNMEPESDNEVRAFMRQKYYEQKWLDRDKLAKHTKKVKAVLEEMFTEEGIRKPGARTPPLQNRSLPDPETEAEPKKKTVTAKPTLQLSHSAWKLEKAPQPEHASPLTTPVKQNAPIIDLLDDPEPQPQPQSHQPQPHSPTPSWASSHSAYQAASPRVSVDDIFSIQPASPSPSTPIQLSRNVSHAKKPLPNTPAENVPSPTTSTDIFSDLAGLQSTVRVNPRRATYTGGILTPMSPGTASPSAFQTQFPSNVFAAHANYPGSPSATQTTFPGSPSATQTSFSSRAGTFQAPLSSHPNSFKEPEDDPYTPLQSANDSAPDDNDPYSALRNLSLNDTKRQPQQATVEVPLQNRLSGLYAAQERPSSPVGRSSSSLDRSSSVDRSTASIGRLSPVSMSSEELGPDKGPAKSFVAPTPSNPTVNLFDDLDPIARFKRGGHRV